MPHHLWIGRELDVWDALDQDLFVFCCGILVSKSLFSAVDPVSDISAEKSGKNSTNPVGQSCPI